MKQKIEEQNARLSSAVSSKTDFLILGDSPGNNLKKQKK